ncbi:MAG: hypothetical protein E7450_08285 [Ruminococcaceae bacterium]|nr:hypothetical protein [Oscillospiraceae bacterium]
MKPVYANTFGLRKVTSPDGDIVEVTLDVSYKYMETAMTLSGNGMEAVSTPAAEQVASLVMTRNSALALRNLLNATLGEE